MKLITPPNIPITLKPAKEYLEGLSLYALITRLHTSRLEFQVVILASRGTTTAIAAGSGA